MESLSLTSQWLLSFTTMSIRYFAMAGSAFLFFYTLKTHPWKDRKIQQKAPGKKSIHREIKYSLSTMLIFSVVLTFIVKCFQSGWTLIYTDIHAMSYGYTLFSFIALIVVHDTYFYWMHRFMHLPKIFQKIHLVHHQSHNPTPWAAFSFHPIEAILEIIWIPIIIFLMPLHVGVLIAFTAYIKLFNVIGHLGYEIFPRNFMNRPISYLLNTSTHHNMHHRYASCNYGLYFNYWDRWMRTNHKKYREKFKSYAS